MSRTEESLTVGQISRYVPILTREAVFKRVNELKDQGVLVAVNKILCPVTGKKSYTYAYNRNPDPDYKPKRLIKKKNEPSVVSEESSTDKGLGCQGSCGDCKCAGNETVDHQLEAFFYAAGLRNLTKSTILRLIMPSALKELINDVIEFLERMQK